MSRNHARIPEPTRNLGKRRLWAVAKSLVRAGLKLVPIIGNSLDALVFGSADELAHQELAVLIEQVLSQVKEIAESQKQATDLENLLLSEFSRGKLMDSELVGRFARLSPGAESLLSRWLLSTAQPLLLSSDSQYLEEVADAHLEEVCNLIIDDLVYSEAAVIDRLEKVEVCLRRFSGVESVDSPPVRQALRELARGSASKRLTMRARLAADQLPRHARLRNSLLTVDFSILHSYAHAFSAPADGLHHVLYILERTPSTLWLLPGTVAQLRKFLSSLTLQLMESWELDSVGELGTGPRRRLGAAMGLHGTQSLALSLLRESTSPPRRLLRLLDSGRIAFWREDSKPEYRSELSRLFAMLNTIRPHRSTSNYLDAINLTTLALHNQYALQAGKPRVIHLSAGAKLKKACDSSATEHKHSILSPAEWSMHTFLNAQNAAVDLEALSKHASRVAQLAGFAVKAEEYLAMDVPPDHWRHLLAEVAELQNSTAALFLFFGPFYDAISAAAEESVAATREAVDDKNDLNKPVGCIKNPLYLS